MLNKRSTDTYIVSIPQAVSAIAIDAINRLTSSYNVEVSIPQAVSAIAIQEVELFADKSVSFNTASGKCYCNVRFKTNYCL